ncbi:MAG: [Fe-Fe] hydrogenase large subunit C-terminal domain-containing protein [Bacillota bacterium]|nr:[Fe-Fe] hydrogenase large subunit C-terminal domain-containing protein [Bacillota bacterium]
MKFKDILRLIDGELLCENREAMEKEYSYAFATDLMSNVMLGNVDDSILITSLVNPQVIRASEMMNMSAIILTSGKSATDTMIQLADNRNIALAATELPTFTVCGKLHNVGITEGPTTDEDENITSIRLNPDRCIGCIHCVRECPTEAIRVRNWKAVVDPERCIECGMCIKVCPRHAMRPIVDPLQSMDDYDVKIAIPSSAFLGQFENVPSRNHLLTAIKQLGFDDVYEEAIGAEIVSDATRRKYLSGDAKLPIISSGCPSILKLIQLKFPNLIDYVSEYRPPVEIVAEMARKEAEEKHPDAKIGIFYIAPCTSKISFIRESDEIIETDVDEMLAIGDVYRQVLTNLKGMKDSDVENLERTGMTGLRWTSPGGESLAVGTDRFIAIDGIYEVMEIFEQIEKDKLINVDFIEADACVGGCLGGSLTVENCYSARANMKRLVDEAKHKYGNKYVNVAGNAQSLKRSKELKYRPVLQLDEDLNVAIKKMEELGNVLSELPGIDCGVCGAPTCKAFAEDVVRGTMTERACLINRRTRKG